MLRERNSIKDVIINWVIMLVVISPMAVLGMLGYLYGMLWLLGAI
tara:strand:- start:314 stop:448 length:135 start_codon:yes stop_codon:yes gene_type:complete